MYRHFVLHMVQNVGRNRNDFREGLHYRFEHDVTFFVMFCHVFTVRKFFTNQRKLFQFQTNFLKPYVQERIPLLGIASQ